MSKHNKRAARFGRDQHYAIHQRTVLGKRFGPWRRLERAWWRNYDPTRDWLTTYRPRRALTPDPSEAR